ncbi:hypothetical protein [Pseudactinotalea terrae]|uniref:hypothetical protein n=1 Tax=Pseudactinotalea terrae TaxID=1743262 RepID=UPI0013912B19|nr:hypothetical protein [Pseudactinotalea terrae]
MSWVTWGFVGLAIAVLAVAAAISRGWIEVTLDPPYEPQVRPADPTGTRSGIEWSEPAAGRSHDRIGQHHPRTTGETAHGRHEAQDR